MYSQSHKKKPTILHLCPSLSEEQINGLPYRTALEQEGNNIITAHSNDITIRKIGTEAYIEIVERRVNTSDIPAISVVSSREEDNVEIPIWLRLLHNRLGRHGTGMDVHDKGSGELQIIYPARHIKASEIDGVFTLSQWIDRASDENTLRIQELVENAEAVPLNSVSTIRTGGSKVTMQKIFEAAGVPVPRGLIVEANAEIDMKVLRRKLVSMESEGFIVKADTGSGGAAVFAEPDVDAALKKMLELRKAGNSVVIQEELPSGLPGNRPQWFRVHVLNGQVIGALKCTGFDKDELGSISKQEPWLERLTSEQKDVAIRAQQASGQYFSGVDILTNDKGSFALETNPDPALLPLFRLELPETLKALACGYSSKITAKRNFNKHLV